MLCPVDQAVLVMSERQGVEIDYCPQCRGVWLDRGELDKIIERSDAPVQTPRDTGGRDWRDDSDEHRAIGYSGEQSRGKKKKRGGLAELFDFG